MIGNKIRFNAALVIGAAFYLFSACGGDDTSVGDSTGGDGGLTSDASLDTGNGTCNDPFGCGDDYSGDDDVDPGGSQYYPELSLSTTSLVFDGLAPGDSAAQSFIISNIGTSVLTVQSVDLSDELAGDFQIETGTAGAIRINPQDSVEVWVTYSPKDTLDDRGMINITSDGGPKPKDADGFSVSSIHVVSRYIGLPAIEITYPDDPKAKDELGRLNFGYVPPGQTKSWTIKIKNTGSGNAVLDFSPFEFESTLSRRAFRYEPLIPPALSHGAETEITIYFEPQAREGAFDDVLTIWSTAPGEPPTISMIGTSMEQGRLTVDRQEIDFGQVVWGTVRQRHLYMTNDGGVPIRFTKIGRAPGTSFDFNVVTQIADIRYLSPGMSQEVIIEYKPTDAGEDTGELELGYDDGKVIQSLRIPIKGIGINPELYAEPDEVYFGKLITKVQSAKEVITLTNPGLGTITINDIKIDDTTSDPAFSVANLPPLPLTVDKNTPATFEVVFKPEDAGEQTGRALIISDDTSNPMVVVSLKGDAEDCKTACVLPNASTECTKDGCEITSCNSGYKNLDNKDDNGCECRVENEAKNNNFCSSATELPSQSGDSWGPIVITGQIVDEKDEDWYVIDVSDSSFFGAHVSISIDFQRDLDADLAYCIYFKESDGTSKTCPPDAINGTQGQDYCKDAGGNTYDASSFISFSGGVRVLAFVRVFPIGTPPLLTCQSYLLTLEGGG